MIESEEEARAFVAARCDGDSLARLDQLIVLLRTENERQNLVSSGSINAVWLRHVADSAQLVDHVSRGTHGSPWLDLGTGAGFPGLVIAAMRPNIGVTLVESRRRRIEWLESAIARLGLANCSVEGVRVESLATFPSSVISARAFAPLPKLVTLARRFSTTDTVWLLPKGRSAAQEVAGLPIAMRRLFHVEQSATDADSGIVVGRGIAS